MGDNTRAYCVECGHPMAQENGNYECRHMDCDYLDCPPEKVHDYAFKVYIVSWSYESTIEGVFTLEEDAQKCLKALQTTNEGFIQVHTVQSPLVFLDHPVMPLVTGLYDIPPDPDFVPTQIHWEEPVIIGITEKTVETDNRIIEEEVLTILEDK